LAAFVAGAWNTFHKSSIWDMVKLYTKQTGIAGTAPRLGVHTLRAIAATNAVIV
jgi:hypothetical protein